MIRRVTHLEYPVRRLADYDDEEEYEQLGTLNRVERETPGALLISVYDWGVSVWFPRAMVWKDDSDVLWTTQNFFERKKKERL